MKTVLIVGAGAAGLMAAGQAALAGANVILFEKMDQPARKIMISGKGRCNLTNNSDIQEYFQHFNRSGRFLHQAFDRFFAPELMQFFHHEGLPLQTERGNRVFPESGKARDVVATLLSWVNRCGVTLHCGNSISELVISDRSISGVVCDNRRIHGDAVIVTTGGASYPATGSSGDGYDFARSAGHTITPLRPALVPLQTTFPLLHLLAGLDLRNVTLRIYIDGKRKIQDFGEVSFSRRTIGGPLTLTHSLTVGTALRAGSQVSIALDLKPALNEKQLDNRLQRDFRERNSETLQSVLRGLLPLQLVEVALQQNGLDPVKPAGTVNTKERVRLRRWLKEFRINISGTRPIRDAIITSGGIDVREVNPRTMESLLIQGLYFAGEILDVDAGTGGYNLQAAFSTGWVAGRNAAVNR